MKLNLGCWKNVMEGWVNVDLYPQSDEVVKDDVKTLATFDDNVADRILALHLIEHISHKAVGRALHNWKRVLKPGGIVEIECPDMLEIARRYVEWHDEYGSEWTEEFAQSFVHKPASKMSKRSWQTLFCGTHEHRGHWNGSAWDSHRLMAALEQAGFVDVRAEQPVRSLPTWGPSIRVVGSKDS